MQNNFLVIPNSLEDIKKLKGCKLLLPLKSFSVGFNYYFDIEEINFEDSYLYINRLLSSNELDELKKIFENLPNNIKGIVFEDLGIYEITKDFSFEKIFFSTHILTNLRSINEYLKYFDSCVITPDLSLEEINYILKNSNKKLCLLGYGHMALSYSRRLLNSNYAKNYGLHSKEKLYVKNTDYEFITVENEFGTVTYDKEIFCGLDEQYEIEPYFFIINLFDVSVDNFLNKDLPVTKGFLDKETFYKLKEKSK